MASKVSIISVGFNLLGKGAVNDLNRDEITQSASVMYDTLYLEMLACHPWLFAMQVGYELNRLNVPTNVDEWQYIYQIPPDLINAWEMRPNVRYARFQDKIYTNELNLKLDYTHKIDENKAHPTFIAMMECAIAAKCAMMVTQNLNIAKLWLQEWKSKILDAQALDSQGQTNPYILSSPLWEASFT